MNIEKVEYETFESVVEENKDNDIYLKFYADWCGPCKTLTTMLANMEDIDGVKVYEVDVDTESELALRFNIRSLPTIAHLGSSRTLVGLPSVEGIKEFLVSNNND